MLDLVKGAESVTGYSPSRQFRLRMTDVTKTQPAAKTVSKWGPQLLSRQISPG